MICAKIIAKNPIETAYHQHCRDIAWRTSRDTERSWAEFAWCLSVSFHVVERRFASCTQESETSKKRIARLESALQATGADETVLRKISDACLKKRMKGISCDVFGPTFHECLFLLFFNPASTKEYCPVRVSDILLFLSGMLSTGSFIVCQTSFARRPAQKLSRGAGNLKNGGFVGPETFNFQPPFWRLPQSLFKF